MKDHSELREDTFCVKCGYNLRTLSNLGKCPECGEAVQVTLSSLEAHSRPPVIWALVFTAIPIVSAYSLTLKVAKVFWFFDESVFYLFVHVTIPGCALAGMYFSLISISRWSNTGSAGRVLIAAVSIIASIEFITVLLYGFALIVRLGG